MRRILTGAALALAIFTGTGAQERPQPPVVTQDKITITLEERTEPNGILDADEVIVMTAEIHDVPSVYQHVYMVCLYPIGQPPEPIGATSHMHYFGDKERDTPIVAWDRNGLPATLHMGMSGKVRTTFEADLTSERTADPLFWNTLPFYCAAADGYGQIWHEAINEALYNMPTPLAQYDQDSVTRVYSPLASTGRPYSEGAANVAEDVPAARAVALTALQDFINKEPVQ